ncbi:M23 family metallopeptidase [Reichenbachiella ulvae]|uniref:M23 family metallopeptidase n=1 Tax=Reichenbachiella ulvae TaxID=2980104 RepID=A0ABT3CRJ0_9BACT|nr:M23 family metallopeptidase [Reichenbachiella ulvae]MCV9386176.1 M23 family metallopeptidase [Reichenbachiella ulvae]
MRLNSLLACLICCVSFFTSAQSPKKGDFIFPVRPQQENYLAGTMGELRSSHFHAGIDIKTSGTTGLPIYAAADGYVQRVRVSTSGYGNVIYLYHPHNESVTVYAHLEEFSPALAAYVRDEQYKKESFEVNLFPDANEFSFKQGEEIAKSGNTGSSSGPHLHFEIRDKQHKILDPLAYGFDEIKDTTPPTIEKVAFVTLDANSRINGMFGRFEFAIVRDAHGNPILDAPISLVGKIGVEVYAYDKLDGARNRNGIPRQTLTLDGDLVFHQNIEELEFNLQRNILVHTNYKRAVQGGRRFNKLYVDEGNELEIYKTNAYDGLMNIMDLDPHHLDIRLEDSYGNISQYRFTVNNLSTNIRPYQEEMSKRKPQGELHGDLLELKGDLSEYNYCEALIYHDSTQTTLQLSYVVMDDAFYLWDMRRGLPDSVKICDQMIYFDFAGTLTEGRPSAFDGENIIIKSGSNALFDTSYIRYRYEMDSLTGQELFQINNLETPLRHNVNVTLYPRKIYDQDKAAVYSIDDRGNMSYMGGTWDYHSIHFRTRYLVPYTIATDLEEPSIIPLKRRYGVVRFKVRDDLSGIKEFRAELNGEWLLMNYDSKRNLLWSDEKVSVTGHFELYVSDFARNISTFEFDY